MAHSEQRFVLEESKRCPHPICRGDEEVEESITKKGGGVENLLAATDTDTYALGYILSNTL